MTNSERRTGAFLTIGRKCCVLLCSTLLIPFGHREALAQGVPVFQGKLVPLTERPSILGKSGSYICTWDRKTRLLRKDMYALDTNIRREERISVTHGGNETVITHVGRGTFEDFSLTATITDNKTVRLDTPSLNGAPDRKLFVFGRAVSEVFSYWRMAVRPYTPGPGWKDPALMAALAPVMGERTGHGTFVLEETGINLDELSFSTERNAYLENVNRSMAYGCTLNKRWATEDCVLNILGWQLFDKETGIRIGEDLVYTLLTGEGFSSVATATWREKTDCHRTSD